MLVKSGKHISVGSAFSEPIDRLEPRIYRTDYNLKFDTLSLIEGPDSYNLGKKFYGKIKSRTSRVLNTFGSRDTNMGVVMVGLKGSGKSLQAKHICNYSEMPVLQIEGRCSSASLGTLLDAIGQKVCIYCDEFEKIFHSGEEEDSDHIFSQASFLSLLQGSNRDNALFLLTANDTDRLNSMLLGRPGRVYYQFRYNALDTDNIMEIVDDQLSADLSEFRDDFRQVAMKIANITPDVVLSVVDEVNRYEESPLELIDDMNLEHAILRYECSFKFPYALISNKENVKPEFYENCTYSSFLRADVLRGMDSLYTNFFIDGVKGSIPSMDLYLDSTDFEFEQDSNGIITGKISATKLAEDIYELRTLISVMDRFKVEYPQEVVVTFKPQTLLF